MKDLIKRITANHEWTPSHPQTESALAEFENNRSCVLPDEMKEFYRAFGEVRLFDSSYKFIPLAEIGSVGVLQLDERRLLRLRHCESRTDAGVLSELGSRLVGEPRIGDWTRRM